MITKELIEKMVKDELAKKIKTDDVSPPVNDAPVVKELDEADALKFENLLLQREIERLRKEIEDQRRAFADKELADKQASVQNSILEKYNVNPAVSHIEINTHNRQLTITPK